MTPPEDLARLEAEDAERERRLAAPDALARTAGWYARNGIAIFPLRPGAKTPLIKKAHPDDPKLQAECKRACGQDGHGLYDATTDITRVENWWNNTPQANIGIRTGLRFDVVDIDGPAGVLAWADQIIHAGCPKHPDGTPSCCDELPRCPGDGHTEAEVLGTVYGKVKTGGDNGGFHIYVARTGHPNGAKMLGGHVDYRGDGGYVVAPPSRVRSRYGWVDSINIAALPLTDEAAA